jgi:hypothetical protein
MIVIARSSCDEAIPHPNPPPQAGEGREGASGLLRVIVRRVAPTRWLAMTE